MDGCRKAGDPLFSRLKPRVVHGVSAFVAAAERFVQRDADLPFQAAVGREEREGPARAAGPQGAAEGGVQVSQRVALADADAVRRVRDHQAGPSGWIDGGDGTDAELDFL